MIGIEFGPTNTGAALFDGRVIRALLLDPESPTPTICRSAVYMTRSGDYFLGSTALNTYFEQNVGRPTRYRKVRVGEIIQVFVETFLHLGNRNRRPVGKKGLLEILHLDMHLYETGKHFL